jgi:hypothetical protein
MRKNRLIQSCLKKLPGSGNSVSFSVLFISLFKNFHDSNWRNDTLKGINAYAACNFQLIHLSIQMPK